MFERDPKTKPNITGRVEIEQLVNAFYHCAEDRANVIHAWTNGVPETRERHAHYKAQAASTA